MLIHDLMNGIIERENLMLKTEEKERKKVMSTIFFMKVEISKYAKISIKKY